jgi:hypothetical protein
MTDDIKRGYGLLAAAFGKRQLPLEVCRSAAGFYLGTREDGVPFSRESEEYWRSRKAADRALRIGDWTQRLQL